MQKNLPNLLTLFRIVLIVVLAVLYFLPFEQRNAWLLGIFILAGLTDWLDGLLARLMQATSRLGRLLDPIADKLIVATALVLLVSDPDILGKVLHPIPFTLTAAVIIGREIVVSGLREWMAEMGRHTAVAVSVIGKVKTASQIVAICFLLYAQPLAISTYQLPTLRIGELLLYGSAVLTLWSMWQYLRAARQSLIQRATVYNDPPDERE